jgi:hypothetical protein
MKYEKEVKDIWKNFVPKSGQADTVQGELLRAVEKLRDESFRNGNINWDEGFEIFIDLLRHYLVNTKIFSEEKTVLLDYYLKKIGDGGVPCMDESAYDEISDAIIEFYKHYGSLPHKKIENLYR